MSPDSYARHCEQREAIQSLWREARNNVSGVRAFWIAALRSQ